MTQTQRTNWRDPAMSRRVKTLFQLGYTQRRVAEKLGVSAASLSQATRAYGWDVVPKGFTRVADMAVEMGVNHGTAYSHAKKTGQIKNWKGEALLPTEVAQQIVAAHQPSVDHAPAGWLTSEQVAEMWGQNTRTVRRKLKAAGLPFAKVVNGTNVTRYYAPQDVMALTPKRYRGRLPTGVINTKELCALLEVPGTTLAWWRNNHPDFPVVSHRGRDNKTILYKPAEVREWLLDHPRLCHYAERMREP